MTDDERIIREALQAGPTPGPWKSSGEVISPQEPLFVATMATTGDKRRIVCRVENRVSARPLDPEDFANATLIAACSPDRIERVLAELERLRAELAEAHAENQEQARLLGISGSVEARLLARVAELERDVAKVRRDAERYRWLRGDPCMDHSIRWTQWEVRCWEAPMWTHDLRREELDAAIDRARGAE